jgi:hypothetical protein
MTDYIHALRGHNAKTFLLIYQVLSILTTVFETDAFYYGMRPKRLGKFQEWYPHMKRKKKIHIDIHHQTFGFWGTTLSFALTQSFRFLYMGGGRIKPLLYWAAIEREGHQHIFDTFQLLATAPGPSNWCDIPGLYVSVRVLIQVEDMFSFWCESYLKDSEYAAVIRLGKSTLNALCQLPIQCYISSRSCDRASWQISL